MSQNRFYSSTSVAATLTSGVSATATLLPVSSVTGFPTSYPYTLIISRDQAGEEVVSVTGASGLNLTVSRAQDGTSGATHTAGATVEHGVSARDFTEPAQHIGGTTGVHGLSGAPVGTTDTQTLSNKTLAVPTIADFTNATHTHDTAAHGGDLGFGSWTSYVPTVTASTTNPTFGAGTLFGRYKQLGKTLHLHIQVELGPSVAGTGSGPYKFFLPGGLTLAGTTGNYQTGAGIWAPNGGTLAAVYMFGNGGNNYVYFADLVTLNQVTPGSFPTNSTLYANGVFEVT